MAFEVRRNKKYYGALVIVFSLLTLVGEMYYHRSYDGGRDQTINNIITSRIEGKFQEFNNKCPEILGPKYLYKQYVSNPYWR